MKFYRFLDVYQVTVPGPVFSYKLRYIVGFWLVEMAISTNQKSTIYRNLYENTAPAIVPGPCGALLYYMLFM